MRWEYDHEWLMKRIWKEVDDCFMVLSGNLPEETHGNYKWLS